MCAAVGRIKRKMTYFCCIRAYKTTNTRRKCGKNDMGRKEGSRNYRRGTSNWIKDYIGTADELQTFPAETFWRSFGVPQMLYNRLNAGLINHRPEHWKRRMIIERRPGKPTDMKVLNFLNMLKQRRPK